MRRWRVLACWGVIVAALAVAGHIQAANQAALNEVLKLRNAGVTEETVITFIQSKGYNFDLSAEDAISLHNQGLSSAVLNAMIASGKGIPAAAPAQAAPAAQGIPPAVQVAAPATQSAVVTPGVIQPAVITTPTLVSQPAISPEAAYFYQELSPYGRWILGEDGQWYWQPTVVASNPDWRPYWDRGHWVYTDNGWYWASDYPWGWAAFHYGRWHLHPHHGWIWQPDRVWGPAWVVWRSGGDYCGWAPLPPGAVYDTHAGRFAFRGRAVEASFDFGLDWMHFNFSLVREMGEQPRAHFHREQEFRAVFSKTTIINNYSVTKVVNNNQPRMQVINHGIDPARVNAVRGRAVETYKIQDLRSPPPKHGHEQFSKGNKTLDVYRPRLAESSR